MSDVQYRQPREPLAPPGGMECHASDLTATIAAEMPLKVAQWRLAEFDQWIPIDGDANLPVGTLVEQNSSGPLRLGYGAWRDLLLGCQFRIGDPESIAGELITAGGRTMKNVAGYDLTKFMVGQRGAFGSIVTITARTYKRPAGALAVEIAPSDSLLGKIIATPLRPRWAILTPKSLWCGWLDDEPAFDLFERLIAEHHPIQIRRQSIEHDIAHRQLLWNMPENSFRASVPPTKIQAFAAHAGISNWSADAAFGIVVGPLENADQERLYRAAEDLGGSVSIFINGQEPQWHPTPEEIQVLTALKKAFRMERNGSVI